MANEFIIETGTAAAMQQVLKNVTAELDKQIAKQKQLVGPQNPSISMFDDTLFSPGQMRRGKEMRRQDEREQKAKDSAMKVLHRQALRENNMLDASIKHDNEERLSTELKSLHAAGIKRHNGSGNGEGRFLGAIPAPARKFFKLGKRLRSMSTIDSFNPKADFNDVDETLGEARDLTGGLNRMARRYSMASRVQGGVPFGATFLSRAVGQIAMPMSAGAAVAGTGAAIALAAAYVGYGAYIKFGTMAAENYRLKSDVDTKWNTSTNSINSSYGNNFVNHKQILQQVTKSLIETDRTKNASGRGLHLSDAIYGPAIAVRVFSEMMGFGRESSLETSASMAEDTAWGGFKRWVANAGVWALRNDNYYISQAEIDKRTKDETERLEAGFDKQYRSAVAAAELGDTAAWRAQNDSSVLNRSPRLKGMIQSVTTGNNPAKIHRQAEEAKYALKQFAFTQSEWKAPRVD